MSPRRPSNACASMRSARPLPYVSAASKKVTPCLSCARRSIATASSSLRSPHQPVDSVHVPKPTSDTVTSAPGKFLYLIVSKLACHAARRRETARDFGCKVSDHDVRPCPPDPGERLPHP